MKLSGWVWLWVGFCLSAIILSYGYFQFYEPNMKDAQAIRENADLFKEGASTQMKTKALARVTKARAKVDEAASKWNAIVAVKTPPKDVKAGGIDLSKNRIYLTLDAPVFRNSVQLAVNSQLRHGGIKVIKGVTVPVPPTEYQQLVEGYFNYPAYPFPVCIFNFGTVTVEGTYEQICENVRGWSNMPNYIAITDGLQLTGTTPKLTGSYTLVVVALVRGGKISPPVGNAGPAAPAGGAPGGAPAGGPPAIPPGGRGNGPGRGGEGG